MRTWEGKTSVSEKVVDFLDKKRIVNDNEHMFITRGEIINMLKIMKGFERKLQEALRGQK
jgi:hypothetical protein